MDRFGKIDVLVNTVGGYHGGSTLHDTSDETWDFVFNLNVRPVFNLPRLSHQSCKKQNLGR